MSVEVAEQVSGRAYLAHGPVNRPDGAPPSATVLGLIGVSACGASAELEMRGEKGENTIERETNDATSDGSRLRKPDRWKSPSAVVSIGNFIHREQ